MIELIPSWEEVKHFSTPLTDGEQFFIQRLEELYASDESRHIQVFVQSNING